VDRGLNRGSTEVASGRWKIVKRGCKKEKDQLKDVANVTVEFPAHGISQQKGSGAPTRA